MRRILVAACLAAPAAIAAAPASAGAQLLGGIVYDPTNYAQNVLTAARALEQVNNQIAQIQQQATSLVNQARNLASLPVSTLASLRQQIDRTRQLLGQAQRIAYNVADIEKAFDGRYQGAALTASDADMVANADARWHDSVGAFEDALTLQAGIVGNLDTMRGSIDTLVTASQSATGALQAAQAGNQLLALETQQLADLTAAIAAQDRAQVLEAADRAATQGEARERFRRFLEGK